MKQPRDLAEGARAPLRSEVASHRPDALEMVLQSVLSPVFGEVSDGERVLGTGDLHFGA